VARQPLHRPLRVLALAGLLVSTAACGARWTDEQRASVEARGRAAAVAVASNDVARVSTVPGSGGAATAVTSPAEVTTAEGQTAAGSPTTTGGYGAPLPCAAPSASPGVTDGEIAVGSISSLSGPVPGLGASSAAAARAYVAHRNAAGGVCGRQIVLREADDGTDNGRYRAVVGELGPQVFGIAGGFALGDVGGADAVGEQALPVVNLASGEAAASLPTVFDINPGFENPDAVIGKYRYLHDQGVTRAALAYLAVDQSRAEANLQRRLMEAAGIEIVLQKELPVSTLSYDSTARSVANSGADYLFFIADVNGEAAMARAVADTGYQLRFAEYFTFAYGTAFVELAGAAADGTLAWLRSLPNEEASSNAELRAFLEWMGQVAPNEAVDPFAVDSWAAAKAFFDTLEALPGPISRDAFVTQLQSITTFDGGGMFGSIRLGAELTNACVVGMRYEGGQWRRITPDSGFLC
jgi:ABC-type branched-subunit amino acid transport system substrate-binding protein